MLNAGFSRRAFVRFTTTLARFGLIRLWSVEFRQVDVPTWP
jgi:hypothetical protein